jgi:hypothetical protein
MKNDDDVSLHLSLRETLDIMNEVSDFAYYMYICWITISNSFNRTYISFLMICSNEFCMLERVETRGERYFHTEIHSYIKYILYCNVSAFVVQFSK